MYQTAIRLPWGNTEPVILLNLIEDGNPLLLAKTEKEFYKEGGQLINSLDGAMNHVCIRPVSLSKFLAILMISVEIGKGMAMCSAIGCIGMVILSYFNTTYSMSEILNGMLLPIIIFLLIPLLFCWLGDYYLNHLPLTKGKGAKWELNRQTGMVTVYKQEEGKRVAYTKPFYEFDAYLTRNPSPQGITYYNLRLQHRYEDLAIGAFMDNPSGSKELAWAAWDFIQNYMDTSKPLPEAGAFEMFRPYDPTSVEFDKKTKRNPRLCRDMTDKQWEALKRKQQDAINNINMDRPNLMANYVDYSQL